MIRNPVNIVPISDNDIEAINALKVKPFQNVFYQPVNVLAASKTGKSIHVIKKQDMLVGVFCLDTRFHIGHTFAQSDTPGICSFVIDETKQGKGLGTEACRMMSMYLRSVVPLSHGFYMLVHVNNAGAYKCCTRAGWTDTQEKYILGHTGPQHILWMPLR